MIGTILPDSSLYLMAAVSLVLLKIPPENVFGELHFSDAWQMVFAIDNSFLIWLGLFALAIWRRSQWAIPLVGAARLRLALDFPLHHDDGHAHFWPAAWWVFESPLSYWDIDHGARWVAPIEGFLALIALVMLWLRKAPWWVIGLCIQMVLAELWIVRQWLFIFQK